jgi:GTP-binding protein
MIDFARITVCAGGGGAGAGSFRHIKGKRYGKADGGSGGKGGDVYISATGDLNTLEPYRFVKNYKAQDGARGLSNLKHGADGEDLVLKVPVGTAVKVEGPNGTKGSKGSEVISKKPLDRLVPLDHLYLFDLTEKGQRVLVARGGQGGRGNAYLRDQFGRRPKAGESGETGETRNLTLELKLIADVGLIGLPNAGKSTLLAALTAARPAIASYPFTTLEPNLGVLSSVKLEDKKITLKSPLILADIPGLIEGASGGRGLGDLFLRHIERTSLLVHLVDATNLDDSWVNHQVVRKELKKYSKDLSQKKEIIVLSKIDLIKEEDIRKILEEFKKHRRKIIPISAFVGRELFVLFGEIKKHFSDKL